MSYNLSIVIPHYNSPEMLQKLIDSIPNKKDIQIIVIDDNSTEKREFLETVKKKNSERVEFYTNNTGIQSAGACRNIGLKYVKGKWLLFADADDFFMPDMYEMLLPYWESDYDQVIFNVTSVYSDTGEIAGRHILHEKRLINYLNNPTAENLLILKKRFAPWAKLYRSELIKNNNICFSEVLHSNDMLFSTKAAYHTDKIAVDKRVLYCITKTKGSLTNIVSEKAYRLHAKEYIKCFLFCKERYTKQEMKALNYNIANFLQEGVIRKLNKKVIMEVFFEMIKSGIPIITLKCFDYYTFKTHFDVNKNLYGNGEKRYQVKR